MMFLGTLMQEHTTYDLYAVLVHRGRAYYGHYYCYVRSSPTTWHAMDDSTVNTLHFFFQENTLQLTLKIFLPLNAADDTCIISEVAPC